MTTEDRKAVDALLNGKELIMKKALSGQRDFPSLGLREFRPTNSWLEKKQIENCLDERLLMVKSERIEKLSDLSVAEWIPGLKKAKVLKKLGKHWDVFGHHENNFDWLYSEETLFLIEMNILQLLYAEVPVSIEQAYLLLINEDCSLYEYRVFSYLSKRGYKVVRHCRDLDDRKTAEEVMMSSTGYPAANQSEETVENSDNNLDKQSPDLDCLADQSEETTVKLNRDVLSSIATTSINENEKKAKLNDSESTNCPSSPDLMIIENTIDIIDLCVDDAETVDDKNMFLNTAGSRSWYPRLNLVFSSSNDVKVVKTFKKSDFFDLGFKSNMEILRIIDRDPNSSVIKPPDQRFIPEEIKTKYGMYMLDLKKTEGDDVPSTSRDSPKPRRNFQHRFRERRNNFPNPWDNPVYNQPFVQNINYGNNINNPMMAVVNMVATAMNMLRPQINYQMYNQPMRPQMHQNFHSPTYNRYNRPNNFRNQSRYHQTNKNYLKREKKKYRTNQPSGLKIITDYVELDDSDEEPEVKMLKKDSKIELIDLSEVDEDKNEKNNPEVVQLSDNESSEEVPIVDDSDKSESLIENEKSIQKSDINETEISSNEKSDETEKTADDIPNWEHFKKVPRASFNPILDFDKVVSKECVYKSLEIFEPIQAISRRNKQLKISFDAYNPTDHFKKTARLLPKLRIIVTCETDVFPTNDDLNSIRSIYNDGVPFLFAVALEESIGFYLYEKVFINKLI